MKYKKLVNNNKTGPEIDNKIQVNKDTDTIITVIRII